MINISVAPRHNEVRFMYQKARTKAQKALLGYIVKSGRVSDPIFGGAFNLLHETEKCIANNRLYNLCFECDTDVATQISNIVEQASLGAYNKYAFTRWDIAKILVQIEA